MSLVSAGCFSLDLILSLISAVLIKYLSESLNINKTEIHC